MSEISNILREECADRKRTARGAFNKKTHNGKRGGVKFPSDYLSKKEKEKMNGEIKSYKMNEPVSYEEFKKYPDDLKIEYITKLRERFDVPDVKIASMMGCPKSTFALLVKNLSIGLGAGEKHTQFKGVKVVSWDNWRLQLEHERVGEVESEDGGLPVSDETDSKRGKLSTSDETDSNGFYKNVRKYKDNPIKEPTITLDEINTIPAHENIWISKSEYEELKEENKILKAKLEMVYLIFGEGEGSRE